MVSPSAWLPRAGAMAVHAALRIGAVGLRLRGVDFNRIVDECVLVGSAAQNRATAQAPRGGAGAGAGAGAGGGGELTFEEPARRLIPFRGLLLAVLLAGEYVTKAYGRVRVADAPGRDRLGR